MRHFTTSLALIMVAVLGAGCRPSESPHFGAAEAEMLRVAAGWFVMGSDAGPPSSRPAHGLFLHAFEIARTETTNEQFRAYVLASGEMPVIWRDGVPRLGSLRPVTGILWKEAAAFCRWYGWRLPTEAEWEKAARGSDQRTYPWGDEWDPAFANTAESGAGAVVDVGSFPAGKSPYDVLDMAGNVQEWVADYFDPAYYQISPELDPVGPTLVLDHGLRGGSWAGPSEQATTYFRDSSHSVRPNNRVGFRCAADVAQ